MPVDDVFSCDSYSVCNTVALLTMEINNNT